MKVGDLVYLEPWLHDKCGCGLWIIMALRHEGMGQETYKVHCVTTGTQRVFHYTNLHKADNYCPG
jgi:hypothetical protein